MSGKKRYKCILCLLLFAAVLCLSACSSEDSSGGGDAGDQAVKTEDQKDQNAKQEADGEDASKESGDGSKEEGSYEVPKYQDVSFSEKKAKGDEEVKVDLSHVASGYVSLVCTAQPRIKFQVLKDDETFNYDVEKNEMQVYPLQAGDGHYVFRVMRNIKDTKYAEMYKCEADVKLTDEFQPFIHTNQFADYSKDSACVKKAAEFAAEATGANDFITKVFDYITKNITYDYDKAENVKPGYLPDPDSTLAENKGICMDYASLAAAMLRSQGIPTKVVLGYVSPSECYHAWNMYYTEEEGWVAVEYETAAKSWNRIDTTFAANGEDSSYIGDGSNYDDVYQY